MREYLPLIIIFGILIATPFLVKVSIEGRSFKSYAENGSNIKDIVHQFIQSLPEVKIFGENYKIESINPTEILGYEFFEVKGSVGGREFTFYITKDGKNIMNFVNTSNQKIMAFISFEDIKKAFSMSLPKKTDKPKVYLFIMSFCPYGNQMENVMKDVLNVIGEKIEFEPVYIYYPGEQYGNDEKYCKEVDGKYYCSMHGIKELEQDLREKAVYKIYGWEKWFEYVTEVDKKCTLNDIDACWKEVAENLGINTTKIEEYVNSNTKDLIERDYMLSIKYNAWGSPTLIVNDATYNYQRDPKYILKYICISFEKAPTECNATINVQTRTITPIGSCG